MSRRDRAQDANMLAMKHTRNTLLVLIALIVPGGSLLLIPLLKKQFDAYRACRQVR
jgi:hypothetical protein